MSTQRKARDHVHEVRESLGLMANGACGQWEVAIDETISGPDRWFIQIEGPTAYFSFEIPSPEMINAALDFIAPLVPHTKPSKNTSLAMGKEDQAPVCLVRDDEYDDRFFLVVGPENTPIVRFSLAGQDLKDMTEALRQTAEDLEDDS